jgi:hypothetical protein
VSDWQDRAACASSPLDFASEEYTTAHVAVCDACPVRAACAAEARQDRAYGVRAGRFYLDGRPSPRRPNKPAVESCPQGHPYTPENTSYWRHRPDLPKWRHCLTCHRQAQARRRARRRSA